MKSFVKILIFGVTFQAQPDPSKFNFEFFWGNSEDYAKICPKSLCKTLIFTHKNYIYSLQCINKTFQSMLGLSRYRGGLSQDALSLPEATALESLGKKLFVGESTRCLACFYHENSMSKVPKKKHVFIRISLRLGNFFSLEFDHVKSSILQYLRGIARSSRTKSCVIKSYLL